MSKRFETNLRRYARLAVSVGGVNLTRGQNVLLTGEVAHTPLLRAIADHAYEAGAGAVRLRLREPHSEGLLIQHGDETELVACWRGLQADRDWVLQTGGAVIDVRGPELFYLLSQIAEKHPARFAQFTAAQLSAVQDFRTLGINGKRTPWTIIAGPTQQWADVVYPDLPESRRLPALFADVFRFTAADQPNCEEIIRARLQATSRRTARLNELGIAEIRHQGPGLDLRLNFARDHLWACADEHTLSGQPFLANSPSFESWGAPLADSARGVMRASMPFMAGNTLVSGFTGTYKKGVLVSFDCEEGKDAWTKMLDTDAGARRLGEAALVAASPISESRFGKRRVYRFTLLDENADSHLAQGNGYTLNVPDGPKKTAAELAAWGLNKSTIHIDYMVGGPRVCTTATTFGGRSLVLIERNRWSKFLEG